MVATLLTCLCRDLKDQKQIFLADEATRAFLAVPLKDEPLYPYLGAAVEDVLDACLPENGSLAECA
jgi:hypothetical protein